MGSLFCLGLHESCGAAVCFAVSQHWLPPSPEQKGFLQSAAFLLWAAWVKCEPADVRHSQPTEESPGDHENQAQSFLFFNQGFFVFLWFHLMCFPLQKLSGQAINPMLRMFGQSISGGVDMDGNGYPGTCAALTATLEQHAEKTPELVSFPGFCFPHLWEDNEAECVPPFPLCYSKLLAQKFELIAWFRGFRQSWQKTEVLKQRKFSILPRL